jgi:hypothetical protein
MAFGHTLAAAAVGDFLCVLCGVFAFFVVKTLTAEIAKDSRSSQRKANPEGARGNTCASPLREKRLERKR